MALKLIEEFIDAVINYGIASDNCKTRKANKYSKKISEIEKFWKNDPNTDYEEMESFLTHENDLVRAFIADALLDINTNEAVRVLKEIVDKKNGIVSSNAFLSLYVWEVGGYQYYRKKEETDTKLDDTAPSADDESVKNPRVCESETPHNVGQHQHNYEAFITENHRNSITLKLLDEVEVKTGCSHFGGVPDVPADFVWPEFGGSEIDDESFPLPFIAQINCADFQEYDAENLLPKKGMLYFFYDTETQPWGFDREDQAYTKVLFFEDVDKIQPAELPENYSEDALFPCLPIQFNSAASYPGWEDYELLHSRMSEDDIDEYTNVFEALGYDDGYEQSKLLGWANVVQGSMIETCEEMTAADDEEKSTEEMLNDWQLLLQLNSFYYEDFELLFGDCGNLYFYIRKTDLANRNFENVWVMLQC